MNLSKRHKSELAHSMPPASTPRRPALRRPRRQLRPDRLRLPRGADRDGASASTPRRARVPPPRSQFPTSAPWKPNWMQSWHLSDQGWSSADRFLRLGQSPRHPHQRPSPRSCGASPRRRPTPVEPARVSPYPPVAPAAQPPVAAYTAPAVIFPAEPQTAAAAALPPKSLGLGQRLRASRSSLRHAPSGVCLITTRVQTRPLT